MAAPAALQEILDRLARALDYAARGDFAQLGSLRGFEAFLRSVLALAAQAGADAGRLAQLEALGRGFDTATPARRREVVGAMLGLLAERSVVVTRPPHSGPKPAAPPAPVLAQGAVRTAGPEASEAARSPREPAQRQPPLRQRASTGVERPPKRRKSREGGDAAAGAEEALVLPSVSPRTGPLSTPINLAFPLRGKLASTLKRRGMSRVGEVLFFFPRDYEDRRELLPIARLAAGERGFSAGRVARVQESFSGRRRMLRVVLSDGHGSIAATWYKFWPSMRDRFEPGQRWLFAGEVRVFGGHWEVVHPEMEPDTQAGREAAGLGEIVPIYPGIERGEQRGFRNLARALVERFAAQIEDPLPAPLRERVGLPPLAEAVRRAHFPGPESLAAAAGERGATRRRLAFDELFFLELALALRRSATRATPGIRFEITPEGFERALALLPFAPTGAQRRALTEIAADMAGPAPMNRLLQGDVGSGKTAVAAVAAALAVQGGYQVAVLAPTEILAEQHLRTLGRWLEPAGIRAGLLTASVPKRRKEELKAALAGGELQLAVGTHALLEEGVGFSRLGLVVVDEQHRFGVLQRATLARKGTRPDVLVMTATPIPRTLAMAAYGDLDLSVVGELPPGRTPVRTRVFPRRASDQAWKLVSEQVAAGRQAFVVYPLVEESEKLDLASATEGAAQLSARFPGWRVGLLHGRMKPEEKEAAMTAFRARELDVLVSTTVIEVGVDVPNATVMVIEAAERFGLSQLHQLRGRVGRGGGESWCLLLSEAQGEVAVQRLAIMERSSDGFVIAEEDLRLRGPGEFLGTRQSGLPPFLVADLARDGELLGQARAEAVALVEADPRLERPEHAALRVALEERWAGRLGLGGVG